MTSRVYYTDPACREFDAVVVRTAEHEGRRAVVLDRTAFYPTSGGQPFDTGTLGPLRVLDTIDQGGEVLHVVDEPATAESVGGSAIAEPALPVGSRVHGSID